MSATNTLTATQRDALEAQQEMNIVDKYLTNYDLLADRNGILECIVNGIDAFLSTIYNQIKGLASNLLDGSTALLSHIGFLEDLYGLPFISERLEVRRNIARFGFTYNKYKGTRNGMQMLINALGLEIDTFGRVVLDKSTFDVPTMFDKNEQMSDLPGETFDFRLVESEIFELIVVKPTGNNVANEVLDAELRRAITVQKPLTSLVLLVKFMYPNPNNPNTSLSYQFTLN